MTTAEAPRMTKARTAAQKRARRRKRRPDSITLHGGETAPQRPAQGARNDLDRTPEKTAMEARMRQGLTEEQARSEMAGCAVGRRLMLDHIPDRAELWEAVKHMRRVVTAYDRAIGSPNRHAQCLRILAPVDAMHADASSPGIDTRTEADRARAAVTAWTQLQGWLMSADANASMACKRHVLDEPDQPITDWTGIVLALRCVSDGVKGRRVTTRRRGAV